MPVLSYPELLAGCVNMAIKLPAYPQNFPEFFKILITTGIRPNEAFDKSKWSVLSGGNFQLIPSKGNNPRVFPTTQLSPYFIDNFYNAEPLFYGQNEVNMKYYWKKFCTIAHAYKGGKKTELYCCRYLYVKSLKLNGLTDAQIQTDMGWVEPALPAQYYNAVIYTT